MEDADARNKGSMTPMCLDSASTAYLLSEDGISASNAASTLKARCRTYISSSLGQEMLGCVSFGLFTYFIGYVFMNPHERPLPYQILEGSGEFVRNLNNNQEYVHSTVSDWQLGVLCVIFCPLLQIIVAMILGAVNDVHKTICVYWLVIPINELVTWCIKLFVGYLRPNFYSLCQPSDDYEYCTTEGNGNLRMSFVSGHASWSFAALTLLHLYLERCVGVSSVTRFVTTTTKTSGGGVYQIVLLQQQTQTIGRYRLGSILCLAPMGLATFIAVSRVVDNKHFPADIVAGSLLGGSIALYCHRMWFRDYRFYNTI